MGCSASKTAVARVRVRDHEAISLLMALDDHLYDALRSGAIKLIIAKPHPRRHHRHQD
jgi:hypothetical protein